MAILHVFETPPEGVNPDWTMDQDWNSFTQAEHDIWDELVSRKAKLIASYASEAFVAGLGILELSKPGIPDFRELNPKLRTATGWEVVAVPGFIPNDAFFKHLSEKRFPVANFLRGADSLDYSEEPDMFHDLFGHLPMLTNPALADFLVNYGHAGMRAEALGTTDLLARLYLYTVEFGLVIEHGRLRGYGAGLLSSLSETEHALTSPEVRRVYVDLPRVMRTQYHFDRFQEVYFAIDSFDELLRLTEETDFASVYARLEGLPPLEPGADCPEDVRCEAVC
ncbi:MAG: phenylalanine 4-monooxygenase [Candidatus Andeanibacterium colombiense]|uniref:Phenylalanine-4-hydroxylase n=1 Tax=Candidatus Andeanibacterium colombiense TaxID=3121345 RepID=A0AAJ6BQN9_9SPHN|nr:MAG: phenylalanine 4-monooxygenase [Sphingomonadaceae bacterium]